MNVNVDFVIWFLFGCMVGATACLIWIRLREIDQPPGQMREWPEE